MTFNDMSWKTCFDIVVKAAFLGYLPFCARFAYALCIRDAWLRLTSSVQRVTFRGRIFPFKTVGISHLSLHLAFASCQCLPCLLAHSLLEDVFVLLSSRMSCAEVCDTDQKLCGHEEMNALITLALLSSIVDISRHALCSSGYQAVLQNALVSCSPRWFALMLANACQRKLQQGSTPG